MQLNIMLHHTVDGNEMFIYPTMIW